MTYKIEVVANEATLGYVARLKTEDGQIFYVEGANEEDARDMALMLYTNAERERKAAEKPQVVGYRKLTDSDIDAELISAIKDKGVEIGALVAELQALDGLDQRAVAIAKTELQTGFMWLVRAVAQPETF